MADQELRDLAKRVQALEDERGVLRALYSFAHNLDHGVKEGWANTWTEDAAFELRRRDGTRTRTEGRPNLDRMAAGGAPQKRVKRMVVAPRVTLQGDEARVVSYFTRVDERGPKEPFVYAFGRYFDRVVRCPDGQWRIKERIAEVDAEVG